MTGKEQDSHLIGVELATACEGHRRVEVGGRHTRQYQAQHESQRRPTTLRLGAVHLRNGLLPTLFSSVRLLHNGPFRGNALVWVYVPEREWW